MGSGQHILETCLQRLVRWLCEQNTHLQKPILLRSLIWGAWHLPVLFAGVYTVGPSRLLSAAGLMVATLAFGAILSWLRPATGSVWPVVIAHTVWNALINAGFTFATQNASKNMWIGETGILVAVTLVIAAMLLRRSWSPRQLVNDMGNTLVEAQEQVGRGIGPESGEGVYMDRHKTVIWIRSQRIEQSSVCHDRFHPHSL